MENIENAEFVKASRLKHGSWCHTSNRQKGEGDISASYSADVIAMHGKVRKPFVYNGYLCVAVGLSNFGGNHAKVYRLMEAQHFEGQPKTYNEMRLELCDAEKGYYHGMSVKHGKKDYVLCGNPIILMEDNEPELVQASLF